MEAIEFFDGEVSTQVMVRMSSERAAMEAIEFFDGETPRGWLLLSHSRTPQWRPSSSSMARRADLHGRRCQQHAAMEAIEFFDGERAGAAGGPSCCQAACRNGGHRVLRWRAAIVDIHRAHPLAAMEAIEFFDGEITSMLGTSLPECGRNGGHRVLRWRDQQQADCDGRTGAAAMEAIEFFDGERTDTAALDPHSTSCRNGGHRVLRWRDP